MKAMDHIHPCKVTLVQPVPLLLSICHLTRDGEGGIVACDGDLKCILVWIGCDARDIDTHATAVDAESGREGLWVLDVREEAVDGQGSKAFNRIQTWPARGSHVDCDSVRHVRSMCDSEQNETDAPPCSRGASAELEELCSDKQGSASLVYTIPGRENGNVDSDEQDKLHGYAHKDLR